MRFFRSKTVRLPMDADYFLSLFSGSESGLATTTAIIAGVSTGTDSKEIVLTTAIVTMLVQAFNAGIGRLSTQHTTEEIEGSDTYKDAYVKPLLDAGFQFIAHISSSVVVVIPIIVLPDLHEAIIWSVGIALVLLFILGLVKGRLVKRFPLRDGMEVMILGALVISIGIMAGLIAE